MEKVEKIKNIDYFENEIRTKEGLNRRLFNLFSNRRKLLRVWLINIGFVILLTAGFAAFLGIINRMSHESPIWLQNASSFTALRTVCIFNLCLLYVPFALIIFLFLAGINGMHKSIMIHYLLWFILIISFIMFIAVCGVFGANIAPWDASLRSRMFN